jgi:hypothetical protein
MAEWPADMSSGARKELRVYLGAHSQTLRTVLLEHLGAKYGGNVSNPPINGVHDKSPVLPLAQHAPTATGANMGSTMSDADMGEIECKS